MRPLCPLALTALLVAGGIPTTVFAQIIVPKTMTSGTQTVTLKPDLAASVDRSTVQFRFPRATIRTSTGSTDRPVTALSVCSGLDVGQSRDVPVPALRFGVRGLSFKSGGGTELRGTASQVLVRLNYKAVVSTIVTDEVMTATAASVAPGGEVMFSFTNPKRPTSYRVTKEQGLVRTTIGTQSVSTTQNYCVPSVDTIDHNLTVTVDPDNRTGDLDLTNNVLRLP